MAKDSTGGIYVFTEKTLIGKSSFGEEKSWMDYQLDLTTKPVTMKLTLTENFFDFTSAYNDAANKVDEVKISEQNITMYSEAAVETGRATAIKKDVEAPVWDIRYTTTWVREDGKWYLVSEHQSPVK